jgi:hypothetical protein
MEPTIKLFAEDCIMYRKIKNDCNKTLQIDLDRLGEWAVENAMKIITANTKAVRFTTAPVKNHVNYFWREQKILNSATKNIKNNLTQRFKLG